MRLIIPVVLLAVHSTSACLAQAASELELRISAYPGARIEDEVASSFRSFFVATGPLLEEVRKADRKTAMPPVARYEGNVRTTTYRVDDPSVSPAAIFSNYTEAFAEMGGRELFSCSNDAACGSYFVKHVYSSAIDPNRPAVALASGASASSIRNPGYIYFYWSGEFIENDQRFVLSLLVAQVGRQNRPSLVVLDVGCVEALETGKISLSLEQIEEGIEATGSVALDGILFDFDSDQILSGSEQALNALVDFLSAVAEYEPSRRFYIVGHTDGIGTVAYNLDLSARRAQGVANAVQERSPKAASLILSTKGVGPFAPIASNRTDEGRSQNRRVMLVEQLVDRKP